MAQPLTERRTHSRFGQPTIANVRAVLRPGHVVALANLSAGGALILGSRPLRPGSRVFLQITIAEQSGGRTAQVVRCAVASLDGFECVQYRSGIRFDDQWDSLWEQCTLEGYRMPTAAGGLDMLDGHVLPDVQETFGSETGGR
jgi:PilZ domain